jgi:hypothetical protein
MVVSRHEPMQCDDERRDAFLLAPGHPLNGVDYVEYHRDDLAPPPQRYRIEVNFLKAPAAALIGAPDRFTVLGGVRVVGIKILTVAAVAGQPLRLAAFADREGDFSTYFLHVDHLSLDPERSDAAFGFKAGCPTDFDCRPRHECEPDVLEEPALDYLAKDYQSFRRLMLDLVALKNPQWQERNPSDLGMTLIELMAWAGDYLSYEQDALPGTEGYLDTCRHRISAARHARLIDYRMHQGRNAATFLHVESGPGAPGVVPQGARLLTRISQPLRGETAPPDVVIPAGTTDLDGDPALTSAVMFETTARARVLEAHNELRIYSWGDENCCLAKGAREAFLFRTIPGPAPGDLVASRPTFQVGEYLLLEEVMGPHTGAPADANPAHRQVVRLVEVEDTVDPVFLPTLVAGVLTPRAAPADPMLPLQRVRWRLEDCLTFPLCLSATLVDAGLIEPVSVARGNIAPADQGRTVERLRSNPLLPDDLMPAIDFGDATDRLPLPTLVLPDAPLTFQPMPQTPVFSNDGRIVGGRHDLDASPRDVAPAVVLDLQFPGGLHEIWRPVPDLLESGPADQHFVAEVDNDGITTLRFGDDFYGRRPVDAEAIRAVYRIGNGRAGALGANALVHIIAPTAAELIDPDPTVPAGPFANVMGIYQPLPAKYAVDPETIDEVRALAPEAFLAETFRAVVEADYEAAALKHPDVAAAKATYRWTGSWHTVFVAIHPVDETNLVRLPGGGVELAAAFVARLYAALLRYKLAGYDLVLRAAQYVPLEIEIQLCIARGHFRGDVMEAAGRRLSNLRHADGSTGFFYPPNFTFGEPVYLSQLYAAVMEVDGVESAVVKVFKRYWEVAHGELEAGVIPMGPFEIPRCDNDRNFQEQGVLRLTAVGGL